MIAENLLSLPSLKKKDGSWEAVQTMANAYPLYQEACHRILHATRFLSRELFFMRCFHWQD